MSSGLPNPRVMPNWPTGGRLLADDEPAAVEVVDGDRQSPFIVICDHAGRRLPRSLGTLGLSEAELVSHIAWDIGARGVATRLATALGAFLACQRYSRLAIDCNRPLPAADSIAVRSERSVIVGNQDLAPGQADMRAREIFHPYHDQIRNELDRRTQQERPSILVTVHTFTPVFLDVPRPWHVGVLFNRDVRLAQPLLRLLRAEEDLRGDLHGNPIVGCNEPYAASEASDFSLVHHGEERGVPYVEIEIRQDLVAADAGQIAWAARLARLLPAAAQSVSGQMTKSLNNE